MPSRTTITTTRVPGALNKVKKLVLLEQLKSRVLTDNNLEELVRLVNEELSPPP